MHKSIADRSIVRGPMSRSHYRLTLLQLTDELNAIGVFLVIYMEPIGQVFVSGSWAFPSVKWVSKAF